MKILFLIHEYPPIGGGAGVALQHLARAIQDRGHDIAILCCGNPAHPSDQDDFLIRRIPIASSQQKLSGIRAWLRFLQQAPRELRSLEDQFKPDVINAHFAFPAGWAATRSQHTIPLVTSIIGADIHDPTRRISADRNPVIYRAVAAALRGSQAVTADSEDLARRTTALYPEVNPEVVHFGVPPLCPPGSSRSDLGMPENHLCIVTLSRLVLRKRLDRLIAALGHLRTSAIHLTILGDGPLRPALEKQAADLGLQDRIQFKGFVTEQEKADCLHHADLFCLPSEHEGFGLVFLEAMSLGTPVLTTATGGQTDIIQHRQNGLLLDDSSTEAITAALRIILDDPTLLTKLGEQAQMRSRLFTPDAAAAGFLGVFNSVLGTSR